MPITRITFSSNMLLIRDNITRVQEQYSEAALPATSGLRINSLSDDASVTSRLFSLRSLVIDNEQYQKNISSATRTISFMESRLAQGADVLERIREIVLRANDPTVTAISLSQFGEQIADLKEEFLSHTNARIDGRYVFSGTAIDTIPFSGTPTTFNGNSSEINVQLTTTLQMPTTLNGYEIFSGEVETAVGADLATTLKDSDGVSLDIEENDTITFSGDVAGVPFSDTLTVSSTTTLSDIAAQIQTSIRAVGAGTETATVRPDGSIRVTAANLAINELALSIPTKTTFNTAFTFPDPITAPGGTGDSDALLTGSGEDIFDVLDDLQEAVTAGDSTAIATHLERLDLSLDQLHNSRADLGIRMQQLQSLESSLAEDNLRFVEDLSDIQDANIDKALSDLVTRETALRLVFASSSRILSATSSMQLNV